MKVLKYKCELKSDIVLNVKSASEGPNKTLDFIPGNCFLGIVAGQIYKKTNEEMLQLFHSGKVRFGDAHPAYEKMRTLRVPASMFYPKMKKASEKCYIHHFYDRNKDVEDNGGPQQLKQCRNGFYSFAGNEGKLVKGERSFAIKSAYDNDMRRSKDEAMFGYESLNKGLVFYFDIEIDDDKFVDVINNSIIGEKRLGRSRSAQYGLVEIEPVDFSVIESGVSKDNIVTIYADGRLIFLDDNGFPTFQPEIKDLGLESGEIDWNLTQIRTFQYSPWNFKRQAYDTDRCGIEKGSVIVVKNCSDKNFKTRYVGCYRNEGFGKVIYNPIFLEKKPNTNGEASFVLNDDENKKSKDVKLELKGTPLLAYLANRKAEYDLLAEVYKIVNRFVDSYKNKFNSNIFASQWGSIRSIAMKFNKKSDLERELFTKTRTVTKNVRQKDGTSKNMKIDVNDAYLGHGVAKDKWEEYGRLKIFKKFFYDDLNDENAQLVLINLASQMAKECKKQEDKK